MNQLVHFVGISKSLISTKNAVGCAGTISSLKEQACQLHPGKSSGNNYQHHLEKDPKVQ